MTATPDLPAALDPAASTEPAPEANPDHVTSPVQTQRDAMTRLADQVAQAQRDQAAAEDEHRQRLARIDSRRDETLDRAQRRHQSRSKAAKAAAQARLGQLQLEHDTAHRQFQNDAKVQRDEIAGQTRDQQKKAASDLEYDRWTAGSVFEGTLLKAKQKLKDNQKRSVAAAQGLRGLNQQIQAQLLRFRMPDFARSMAELAVVPDPDTQEDGTAEPQATAPPVEEDPAADALVEPDYPEAFDPQQPTAWYERAAQRLVDEQQRLSRKPLPRAFVGEIPWAVATLLVLGGAGAGLLLPPQFGDTELGPPVRVMIGGIATLFVVIGVWWLLFRLARKEVARSLATMKEGVAEFREALATYDAWAVYDHARRAAEARTARDAALQHADATHVPVIERLREQRRTQLDALNAELQEQHDRLKDQLEADATEVRLAINADLEQRAARAQRRTTITKQRHDRDIAAEHARHKQRLVEIERYWIDERDVALQTLADLEGRARADSPEWSDGSWSAFTPPSEPASVASFGRMRCRPRHLLSDDVAANLASDLESFGLPDELELTAALATPGPRSWLIEAEPADRPVALSAMRSLVLRLLTIQPPGRVRLTLLDPVGLGESFAALMHLADYDERLVNDRVWSEPAQMEQRLVDLTDHMSMVIQKYLRNDFETIEAYNAQAGELAEPYRFLVMADFPHGLSDDGLARLASIASSGARCGVFVLLLRDPRKPLLKALDDDLKRHCVALRRERLNPGDRAGWRIADEVFGHFPLTLDEAPDDALHSSLIHRIGTAAVDADRVQVPFESITPTPEQRWTADSAESLSVPIGRTGATRLQSFALGQGVEQHALIAGKTGSGKSSLLHALVTNLSLWYPPDQLEVYLIDFKKGVEFKPYVTHRLPHARAIAIESDRSFGLSILRELDRLMDERGEKFRAAGVQVLAQYRKAVPDEVMPRVLLVVDEFQELFSRDDQIAQDAALLLDRLVRQGRAFGVHALMGSQSLSGAAGLARGTMGQMAVRIALQCNEADSQLILNDENAAARLLNRPGEAIYNPRGGDLEGNSVFQVAWLPDEEHAAALRTVDELRESRGLEPLPRAVFEGSAPALLQENAELHRMLHTPADQRVAPRVPLGFVGEPIAIEAPTAMRLPREPGAHALIVGGGAEGVLPLLTASILSLAAQHPGSGAKFVLFNGSSEPEHDDHFQSLAEALPHELLVVSPRDAEERLAAVHGEMKQRLSEDDVRAPGVYAVIFGLQRFRDFRKAEDSFSFGSLDGDDDGGKPIAPDKALGELLRDGPALGVHLIAWADRAAAVDPVFDRRDLREIDSRVLFQMSANDSAQLIDSTDANELGPYRALLQREDRGTMTRFRPYGPIDAAWLRGACANLT